MELAQPATSLSVQVLGGFRIRVDAASVPLPRHAERVLAYVVLRGPTEWGVTRATLASALWSGSPAGRAMACVRTALWRIRRDIPGLIEADRGAIRLAQDVAVDVEHTMAAARAVEDPHEDRAVSPTDLAALGEELLPGWDEDWLIVERERLREVRVHVLEMVSVRATRNGRFIDGLNAAYAALALDPLRESAVAALIELHLAQGNVAEAHRHLERYATLLHDELGAVPSRALVARVVGARGAA